MTNTTTAYGQVHKGILDALRDAAAHIDELRLQTSLGQKELREAYDRSCTELQRAVSAARAKAATLNAQKPVSTLVNDLERLEVQLSLGVAESAGLFQAQEQELQHTLAQLTATINRYKKLQPLSDDLMLAIMKFKTRLELLALHYKLDNLAFRRALDEKRAELEQHVATVSRKQR